MDYFLATSLLAAVLFALASLLSKHFLDREVTDYIFTGAVFGWPYFTLYTVQGV